MNFKNMNMTTISDIRGAENVLTPNISPNLYENFP